MPGLTAPAGAFIRARAQAVGASPTTLRLSVWADGTAEPAPLVELQDGDGNRQAAGNVGVRAFLGAGTTNQPVTFGFDDFFAG